MGFHETRFPTNISEGSRGGPGFSVAELITDGGQEYRTSRWESERRMFDASYGIRGESDISDVLEFFIARQGSTHGFRYKDWSDFSTGLYGRQTPTNLDVQIGVGDNSTKVFQLVKKYTDVVTRTRTITKPVSGTVVIAIDGVNQASGWTVDTTTGEVTFDTAPATDEVITAGFEFDVPVRFGNLDGEGLQVVVEDYDNEDIPSIPIVELKDPAAIPGEFFFGGGAAVAVSADFSLSLLTARVYALTPDASGHKAKLPAVTGLPAGGPYFFITNLSGSYSVDLTYDDETAIATIAASSTATVYLVGSTWYVST